MVDLQERLLSNFKEPPSHPLSPVISDCFHDGRSENGGKYTRASSDILPQKFRTVVRIHQLQIFFLNQARVSFIAIWRFRHS